MPVILAFGDSITYGSWDEDAGGWTSLLRLWLDAQGDLARRNLFFYSLGVAGDTTAGLRRRFTVEAAARQRAGEALDIILAFGANDATFVPSLGRCKVAGDEFEANLGEVLQQAGALGSRILLLNITAVVDEVAGAPPGRDRSRLNQYVQAYNQRIAALGERYGVPVIDVYGKYRESDHRALLSDDGFHPNAAGHAAIYELVRDYVAEHWS